MAKSKGKSRSTQVRSKLAIQVGERIRKTRKQEGLSIENFALRCDIHPSYVGHIERGMQNPTLSTLERISKAAHEAIGFTYTPLEQLAALQ